MNPQNRKTPYKKIALALSLCALLLWTCLGAGASLAWFSDTSENLHNIFHFADFDVEVSHQLTDGSWEVLSSQKPIFDENALYEPGYVQVVYLKIENKGDRAFHFNAAVGVTDFTPGLNGLNQPINLQDHLRFGITTADTPEAMKSSVADRAAAKTVATEKLNHYVTNDFVTDNTMLEPGKTKYMALVVRMPEECGNRANYRNGNQPEVQLGLIVKAEQIIN